jgi:hypothetical protein
LLRKLTKMVVERALEGEPDDHPGQDRAVRKKVR